MSYLRMLPEGGLTLGNFSYLDLPDVPEEVSRSQIAFQVNQKSIDSDYQKVYTEVKKSTYWNFNYVKETFTTIFFYTNKELMGDFFLAKIVPPLLGLEGEKDFINGLNPSASKWLYTKEFAEAATRLINWLFASNKVDAMGSGLLEKRISDKWEPNSNWCDMHTPRIQVRREYIIDDNVNIGGEIFRALIAVVKKEDNPVKTEKEMDDMFANWVWKDTPYKRIEKVK